MIKIKSFKKQRYVDGRPTGETYQIESLINPKQIVFITSTKTSIPSLNYEDYGSKITMTDGSVLTSEMSPEEIYAEIKYLNKFNK
jgi:hypothetical protein